MKKLLLNLKNSLTGLISMLSEHSFVLELMGGLILIPYILFADINYTYKNQFLPLNYSFHFINFILFQNTDYF